jgi:hypothetical protein
MLVRQINLGVSDYKTIRFTDSQIRNVSEADKPRSSRSEMLVRQINLGVSDYKTIRLTDYHIRNVSEADRPRSIRL